ncbi:MAG: hypothetical protein PHF44_00945 [Candidatus Pacebacteria bacterium]|nr:hypothetical protein [Candidatus Paceibacterota bacterium]
MGLLNLFTNLFKKTAKFSLSGRIKEERITPQELLEAKRKSADHPEILERIVKNRIDSYEKLIDAYHKKGIEVPRIVFDNHNTLKEFLRNN